METSRTRYIICGTQWKMKMQGSCSNSNKNFKIATAEHKPSERPF